MRKVYQFDGINGGTLSIGECSEPEQVLVHVECSGNDAHMRLRACSKSFPGNSKGVI
jgi:hypothetical protein